MEIDPKIAAWINVAFMILTGIGAGAVGLADLPQHTASVIKTLAADGAFAISCLNTVFHLWSAPTAGPLVK